MADAKLSVEVGAKIDELQSKMAAAKASVKSFTGYTDAELLKTSQNYQNFGGVNERLAEKVAATAKAQRLAAEAQKLANIETIAGTNAITGLGRAATKGLSALRNIAYVLPGIGVAGIFTLAFEAITPLISQLDLFNSKLSETKGASAVLGGALASTDYKNAVSNVTELTENFRLAREGILKKSEVLKEYNDTIGKTIGKTDDFNTAEKTLIDQAPAYIKFTLLKAAAQLALEQSTKKTLEAAEKTNKQSNAFTTTGEKIGVPDFDASKAAKDAIANGAKTAQDVRIAINKARDAAIANPGREEQIREIAGAEVSADKFLKIFKDFQDKAAEISKENGFKFFDDSKSEEDLKKLQEKKAKAIKDLADLRDQFKLTLADATLNIPEANSTLKSRDAEKSKADLEALIENAKKLGDTIPNSLGKTSDYFDKTFDKALKKVEDLQKAIESGLTNSFTTFFDDILQHGTFSFAQLGKNILHEFEKIIISQEVAKLATLLTGSITGESNGKPTAGGILGGIGGLIGLVGKGGAGAAAGATAGSGGLLLPVIAGIAGIALISSLFKKHKTPDPVYTSNNPISSGGSGGGGFQTYEIRLRALGPDLVGVLNIAGYNLSRSQQRGG